MSWHTSGLLIHADHSRDLPGLFEKQRLEYFDHAVARERGQLGAA